MINVTLKHPGFQNLNLLFLKRTLGKLKWILGIEKEINLLLVDDKTIVDYNEKWFSKKDRTNVISFSYPDTEVLGDIIISLDTVYKEAQEASIPFNIRLIEVLIHGLLHLFGYRDDTPEYDIKMYEKEIEIKTRLFGEGIMPELCVNIDHVATLRQARRDVHPEPIYAALIAEHAGADGIVVHLREDRRHINDRDVRLLREVIKTKLNLEMAATEEMLTIAERIKPDIVTLVPEKRMEITTEGGLDLITNKTHIANAIKRLHEAKIPVSLFVDPDRKQIEVAKEIGADCIEIHTGNYAHAFGKANEQEEYERIVDCAAFARDLGLRVHAGHGLDYRNAYKIAAISDIEELSIGFAIIARSVFVGLERAVKEMLAIVKKGHVITEG